MANLNRVQFIGRLTRDPGFKSFATAKLAEFGFAFTGSSKKNAAGQWEDEPCFVECKAWDRDKGKKLATLAEKWLRKGTPCYIEGKLQLETWDDKAGGGKRSKHVVSIDDIQVLEFKKRGDGPEPEANPEPSQKPEDIPF